MSTTFKRRYRPGVCQDEKGGPMTHETLKRLISAILGDLRAFWRDARIARIP